MLDRTCLATLCVLLSSAAAHAQLVTNSSGSAFPQQIDTRQPSLSLHMMVQLPGTFGIGVPIRMFAYTDSVMAGLASQGGWIPADGRLLSIAGNQGLFSLLGTTYGGNGINTFALPDLRGRAMMGESDVYPRGTVSGSNTVALTAANVAEHTHAYSLSPTGRTYFGNGYGLSTPFAGLQPALAVFPVIITTGSFPGQEGPYGALAVSPTNGYLSQVQFLTGALVSQQAASRTAARGAFISIPQNTALFALMWNTYGGNATSNYELPDLGGRLSVSKGQGTGLTSHPLGEYFGTTSTHLTAPYLPPHSHTVTGRPATGSAGSSIPFETAQPTLTISYYIATYGIYPTQNSMNDTVGYVGEVIAMAVGGENFVPSGYLPCDGQVLPIDEYDTLFSLIGNTYGGDGFTTFALPDLRGAYPPARTSRRSSHRSPSAPARVPRPLRSRPPTCRRMPTPLRAPATSEPQAA
ncbi:MAG: tail fiber protein [Phycisphaerales bacterium]